MSSLKKFLSSEEGKMLEIHGPKRAEVYLQALEAILPGCFVKRLPEENGAILVFDSSDDVPWEIDPVGDPYAIATMVFDLYRPSFLIKLPELAKDYHMPLCRNTDDEEWEEFFF